MTIRLAGAIVIAAISLFPITVRATVPVQPPPCGKSFDAEPVARLVAQVKDIGAQQSDAGWSANCASEALGRKREDVIPVLVSLMETHDSTVEWYALGAVCGPGHSGASAVPYIERRLRAGGMSFAMSAYPTLACIGAGSQEAIPLLMDKSRGIDISFPWEPDLAVKTLGALYKYAPDRVLPDLIELLDQPTRAKAAAEALQVIGKPARPAESALRRNLGAAVDAGQHELAAPLISALADVGRPQPTVDLLIPLLDRPGEAQAATQALRRMGPQAQRAVPALVARLNSPEMPWQESGDVATALIAVDAHSPTVLRAVVGEFRRTESLFTAAALAGVKPFPPELAPDLLAVIDQLYDDDASRSLLEEALAHTGSALKVTPHPRPSPEDVSDRVIDGLLTLTRQSQKITPDDLIRELRIDPRDYFQEGNSISLEWRRKPGFGPGKPGSALIDSIRLFGVWLGPAAATQTLDIALNKGACLSMTAMESRPADPIPASTDPNVVIVSANPILPIGTYRFDGDHPPDKSKARSNVISLPSTCGRTAKIEKSFDRDYWNYDCPFTYDSAFADRVILPALQKQLGPSFGRFDFGTPEIRDQGTSVGLTYKELQAPGGEAWQAFRISLVVDRCSGTVSSIRKYIP